MPRLVLLSVVSCALGLGCGASPEDELNENRPPAAGGAKQLGAATNATPGAPAGSQPQESVSANPVTSFFQGLDRAAKRAGADGQR